MTTTSPLTASFRRGTHRLVEPEVTLERIQPALASCGITRLADLTGLDVLGIPTYSAIRPTGTLRQASMGKGLTPTAAKVSALMEAIEISHVETPEPGCIVYNTRRRLLAQGHEVPRMVALPGFYDGQEIQLPGCPDGVYESDDYRIGWVRTTNTLTGNTAFLPAGTVYHHVPSLHRAPTNGVASGNHIVEAELHALYELIEREALASFERRDYPPGRGRCERVDLDSVECAEVSELHRTIIGAGLRMVLISLPSVVDVHTMLSFIVDDDALRQITATTMGCGTHSNIEVAACRAITEAAQSRIGYIQAVREELGELPAYNEFPTSELGKRLFSLPVTADWAQLASRPVFAPALTLTELRDGIVNALADAGHPDIYRFDLTKSSLQIPVVRIIIPTLRFPHAVL